MGEGPNIPWRLLEVDILVEDKETGGKHFIVFLKQTNCKFVKNS